MYVLQEIWMYACVYIYTIHIYIYVCQCMCVCMYMYIHMYTNLYRIRLYIYIYIQTNTNSTLRIHIHVHPIVTNIILGIFEVYDTLAMVGRWDHSMGNSDSPTVKGVSASPG